MRLWRWWLEVDPFQSEFIDGEWLVFHRKVWFAGPTLHPGLYVTDLRGISGSPPGPGLPQLRTAGRRLLYLLFYQGEILAPSGDGSSDSRPLLALNSAALPYPLSDFHLAITVGQLPEGPGYQLVNFLAIFLSLLFRWRASGGVSTDRHPDGAGPEKERLRLGRES